MKQTLSLFIALLLLGVAFTARGETNWKMHTTFDEEVTRLIDTDEHIYFLSRPQPYDPGVAENSDRIYSLFRYDKGADELLPLSTDNLLSANLVEAIEYSPEKGMLVVVYKNHAIDLLYDDGRQANIPAYRLADVAGGKEVNSIFIDALNDRIYLATGFGYVALNDKKLEVAESRNYGEPIVGLSRCGFRFLLLTEDALYEAPVSEPRFNLQEYREVSGVNGGLALVALGEERSLLVEHEGNRARIHVVACAPEGLDKEEVMQAVVKNIEHNGKGVTVAIGDRLLQFYPDGGYESVQLQNEDRNMAISSHDFKEIWFGSARRGIRSKKYSDDSWTLTRDFMTPASPAPFKATHMAWHDDYGLLVANHGYDRNFLNHTINSPILLSGYKGGRWSNLSPAYTSPQTVASLMNPNGLAIDPDNPGLVYFGSLKHGLERINLQDGSDVLHLSRTSDPFRNEPGFVEVVRDQTGEITPNGGASWREQCMFSPPEFDAYGNMWTAHCDYDDQHVRQTHIYCWETADRRVSTDATSYRPMKRLAYKDLQTTNFQFVKPLVGPVNRDILLWTPSSYDEELALIHTNGTPGDNSDDRVVRVATFTDQDGTDFDVHYIYTLYEDPQTGYVWAGHHGGVFYFNPTDWLEGKTRVNRVKVARNDGTNLADYLLDQVGVLGIASDGGGRKWFATSGAGVVCTTSDGRIIETELNTGNSPLPDDIVYGLGYVADNNSMLFSTDGGIAEYFLPATSGNSSQREARAYPNPVRPDYGGYVTIDGIPEGNLVKIMDSRGNLVKELGYVAGGEVKWDVTDLSYRRVGSGVYFILTSSGENGGSEAGVGKILVVN